MCAVSLPIYRICAGDVHSFSTDLWSAGVILYEITTLTVPFTGRTFAEVAARIRMGRYENISVHRPDLGKWARRCVLSFMTPEYRLCFPLRLRHYSEASKHDRQATASVSTAAPICRKSKATNRVVSDVSQHTRRVSSPPFF